MSTVRGDAFWERVHTTFGDALDRPADERPTWVREVLADEPDVAREVLALLSNHDDDPADSFLEPPPRDAVARGLQDASTVGDERPGLPDLTGRTIVGRYSVGERLGSGGAGVVYRATDRVTGGHVALKAMPAEMDARLLRHEAAILRALRLPGVVDLLDDGVTSDGVGYLVTELVEGTPFPGRRVRAWWEIERTVVALLETLDRIHRAGIVHRDLKPGNVLVRPDGLPVVLDLGVSEPTRTVHRGRVLHERAGTLRYMAPEQLRKGRWSPRSDLHAVGVMIHEALAGEAVRSEVTAELARAGVMPERPRPLAEAAPDAPAEVCEVVDQMLAPDPDERPATAQDVLRSLPRRGPDAGVPRIERDVGAPGDLVGLFHGPDRLHHLRADAAQVLWHRTGGQAADVREELAAWDRAGLGRWEAGRFRLDRPTLDRLRAGLRVSRSPPIAVPSADPIGAELEFLLAAELAGPRTTSGLLAAVLDIDADIVAAGLRLLRDRGFVRRVDARWEVLRRPRVLLSRLAEDVRDVHHRIAEALPADDERRILHRVAAGEIDRVPTEVVEMAGQRHQEGEFLPAHIVLEGLRCLTARADPAVEVALLERLLASALRGSTRAAFDELLYRLSRGGEAPRIREMERVARGALRTLEGAGAEALAEIPDPRDIESPLVRDVAFSARLFAVRRLPIEEWPRWIDEAEVIAEELDSAGARFVVVSARAWLAYAEDRYADAANLHLEARTSRNESHAIALATLNAASAFLEAGDLDRAEALARDAADGAIARRDAFMEGRAERVVRAAAYRRGDELEPDLPLVDATQRLSAYLGALVALNEAGIAWRSDRADDARRLATDAARAWRASQSGSAALLAESLALATGAAELEPGALLAACSECEPRIRVQMAALIAVGVPDFRARCRATIEACAAEVRDDHAVCLELVSVNEAFELTELG